MNKKGFTLVELLGVIVIITLILLVALPTLTNVVKNKEGEIEELEEDVIIESTKLFIENNIDQYEKIDNAVYCIPLITLKNNEYLKNVNSSNILNEKAVKVTVKKDFVYELVDNNKCSETNYPLKPDLHNHSLTPIIYSDSSWKVADENSTWYNYENKEWANAVILKEGINKNVGEIVDIQNDVQGIFVWIPRYEYKIDGENNISINFINKFSSNNDYIIPKAFTFGDKELSGIWVGKYQTNGDIDNPTILSNSTPITNQNIKTYFETAQKFNKYLSNGDSHMAKNSEFGAVIYLSRSKYGLVNETSTTSNETGIYDINGSTQEYTMSVYNKIIKNSGFTTELDSNEKYYDNYDILDTTKIIGEGISEIQDSTSSFVTEENPWLIKPSLFKYNSSDGSSQSNITFRIIVS